MKHSLAYVLDVFLRMGVGAMNNHESACFANIEFPPQGVGALLEIAGHVAKTRYSIRVALCIGCTGMWGRRGRVT